MCLAAGRERFAPVGGTHERGNGARQAKHDKLLTRRPACAALIPQARAGAPVEPSSDKMGAACSSSAALATGETADE